jgi:Polysaccharide biosynthesis/export protein/SLBB domain
MSGRWGLALRLLRTGVTTLLLVAGAVGGVQAQGLVEWNPSGLQLTRVELDTLLARYQRAGSSGAYSKELRERATKDASLIRDRLQSGDFKVGDRIYLAVQGEQALTDTFTVVGNSVIHLPVIGDISLKGVLRSELEPHLTQELSRYIKDPKVTARSLLRVGILGQVRAPGFYVVPSTSLLTDVIMTAGGPGPDADLHKLTIERGQDVIWDGGPLQTALSQGRTLDQLNLEAGDEILVPQTGGGFNVGSALRYFVIIVPPLVFALSRFIH